jgi:hypothetical protein
MADESTVPDIYCDSVQIGITGYDLMIELQKRAANLNATDAPVRVATVRMSHEHAKVLAIMLARNLHEYESASGSVIPIHPALRQTLGLSKSEDW